MMSAVTSPSLDRITSLTNPRVKAAVRLRDRRAREQAAQTLIDGTRELGHAITAGVTIREVFACPELVQSSGAADTLARLEAAGHRPVRVSAPVFEKLAFGDRSEGLVAVADIPTTALANLRLPTDPLVIVVESVEKPGNLGAVLRTADGAGADAVVAASPRTDLFNPNVIRASLGTIFSVPLGSAPTGEVKQWLRDHGLRALAAAPAAERLATETNLTGPLAIILGAEADGLGSAWAAPDVERVRLPMLGVADSLNVSAAAAALLYEARRQRGIPAVERGGPAVERGGPAVERGRP